MPSSKPNGSSSASESDKKYVMVDERKRKRMLSNRESARRSRMRKQKQLQDLTEEVGRLQAANNEIVGKIDGITEKYMTLAAGNNVLIAQEKELTDRLKSLNDVISSSGLAVDATQVPDPLLKPWHLPCPMPAIPASFGFQF